MPQSSTLTYLAGDHLGSTSLAVDASTGEGIQTRYKPWGEVRYTTPSKTLPTRYTFTGQYSYVSDDATDLGNAGFGLMFYNARWYDPLTGRMAQADTIVPGGLQGLDRYAYVGNNPIVYTDPSGHAQYRSDYQQQIHDNQMKEYDPKPKLTRGMHGLCEDFDTFGNCEVSIDWLLRSNPQEAIELIAEWYGIQKADDDYWRYEEELIVPGGLLDGWTPRDESLGGDMDVVDKNGNKLFDDAAIFISGDAFKECKFNIDCIAAVMTHEGMHSQIEYAVEQTPGFGGWHEYYGRQRYLFKLEEIYVDQTIIRSGAFPAESLSVNQRYLAENMEYCLDNFIEQTCGYAMTILQAEYGISLQH